MIEISFDKRLGRGGGRDLPPSEISFPAKRTIGINIQGGLISGPSEGNQR